MKDYSKSDRCNLLKCKEFYAKKSLLNKSKEPWEVLTDEYTDISALIKEKFVECTEPVIYVEIPKYFNLENIIDVFSSHLDYLNGCKSAIDKHLNKDWFINNIRLVVKNLNNNFKSDTNLNQIFSNLKQYYYDIVIK